MKFELACVDCGSYDELLISPMCFISPNTTFRDFYSQCSLTFLMTIDYSLWFLTCLFFFVLPNPDLLSYFEIQDVCSRRGKEYY